MIKVIFLSLLMTGLSSCTKNIFDEIADKDSPEAIYFQAKLEINNRDYTAAITLLESLNPAYLADRSRVAVYASAYSGRCGLELLTLMDNLQNGVTGSIFLTLMAGYPGALAAHVADCNQSQQILSSIGDESARDGNENLLMAFTSLSEMGTILSFKADSDADGAVDGTFDQCAAASLSEDEVREFGSNIATTLLSLTAIGTSYIDGALDNVRDLCALDPSLAAFCNTTDPAAFTDPQVQALRFAIGSNDFGINSCGNRDFTTCATDFALACPAGGN